MDVNKVIEDLRAYRAQIDEAIAALEGLARRREKKRGRPPKWMSDANAPVRAVSEETKKKMAVAQKRRWAASRRGKTTKMPAE